MKELVEDIKNTSFIMFGLILLFVLFVLVAFIICFSVGIFIYLLNAFGML